MIRPYPPPWLKRPDTLTFKSGFTGWWFAWFFLPIPYSQLLPEPWSLYAFAAAVPVSLFLLYKCLASKGRLHMGRLGIAWRIGFRRGWLPWEEILEVRVEGAYLPRLILKHSQGEVSLPFQSVKRGSELFFQLAKRFPAPSSTCTLSAWRRISHLDYVVGGLLFAPVHALSGSQPWSDYAFYAVGMLLALAGANSPLASGDVAQRILADAQGIRWQNHFLGRWRSLSWSQITMAELDLDADGGSGVLRLQGEAGEAVISAHTSHFLEVLHMTRASLPIGVKLQIRSETKMESRSSFAPPGG